MYFLDFLFLHLLSKNETYLHPAHIPIKSPIYHPLLICQDLPNPFILIGTLKKLDKIVEKCTVGLDSYSRYVGRVGNSRDSLNALSLLPSELIKQSPVTDKVIDYFNDIVLVSPKILTVEQLYELFGETSPMKITKKEAENLAKLLEGMDFGVIPDARFYNIKPDPDGQVVVFPKGKLKPGDYTHVTITDCTSATLMGNVV